MLNQKEKIEENKAIARFIVFINSEIENKWNELRLIIQQITEISIDKNREDRAKAEIKATYFALELLVLANLLTEESGYRITHRLDLMHSKNPVLSEFWKRVLEYENCHQLGLQKGEDPKISVAALLYSNLVLHCAIDRNNFKILSDEGAFINPTILSNLARLLSHYKPFWRLFLEQYEIIESDLPITNECPFEDYLPDKESDHYPDGTYFIKDELGNLKKGWRPPEFFHNLMDKGIAERVYQVLIKGPWVGIKQMKMQLTEEQKSQFLDEHQQGYAIVWYEKEEMRCKLLEKQIWDKIE